MFDKIEQLERRYGEITDRVAAPGISPDEMRDLLKEQASIREVVETYIQLKKIRQDISDNKKMLVEESDASMRELAREDLTRLEKELVDTEERLKFLLLPRDPRDSRGVIVEIRAGTGGEEAALFGGVLFRMYLRYAERRKWPVEILSENETGRGGYKEIIFQIDGKGAWSRLKFEGGVHRVQRVPETEASGRIHTSAVTVVVMPEAEESDLVIPESEIKIDVMRAGGAGGQHVNKTESAVRLTHIPTGTVVVCKDERSQHKNRARAMNVLRARLLDLREEQERDEQSRMRKALIGTGDRSEKIRTYNFPQSRVTDHRIGLTIHQLESFVDGDLDSILDPLMTNAQAELLKRVQDEDGRAK